MAGTLLRATCFSRGLRTSWLIVGMNASNLFLKSPETTRERPGPLRAGRLS
jgi:hypothetical protein